MSRYIDADKLMEWVIENSVDKNPDHFENYLSVDTDDLKDYITANAVEMNKLNISVSDCDKCKYKDDTYGHCFDCCSRCLSCWEPKE